MRAGAKVLVEGRMSERDAPDAAYVELTSGESFVVVTFTVGHIKEKGIFPAVAREVIAALRAAK